MYGTTEKPNDSNTPTRRWRRTLISGTTAVAVLAGASSLGALGSVAAQARETQPETVSSSTNSPREDRLEARLNGVVDAGYPAALASVRDRDGTQIDIAVGEGDLEAGTAAPVDGEVRIASNTKIFVATIVMQLAQEGLVDLDEPIDKYLPGLVTGEGINGSEITVRQLLQQTSGLPEYADEIAYNAFEVQHDYISPRDMLDVALDKPANFAPGEQWEYSNTNYLVLGLLIERVTQRPLDKQIDERIVQPLGLERTYLPMAGEQTLRGEHPNFYHSPDVTELRDISEMDSSFAWSAGGMVSTPSELNLVMQAVLDGTLLDESSMTEMQDAVPAGDELWPEATYGLGLQSYPLSCGGSAWGHGGDIAGTQTRNAVGPDGTAVTVAVTSLPWAIVDPNNEEELLDSYRLVVDVLDETLCD